MQQVLLASLLVGAVSLVVGETDSPSHLKPFGWGNAKPLEEVQGFIPVKQFFEGELMRFLTPLLFYTSIILVGYCLHERRVESVVSCIYPPVF